MGWRRGRNCRSPVILLAICDHSTHAVPRLPVPPGRSVSSFDRTVAATQPGGTRCSVEPRDGCTRSRGESRSKRLPGLVSFRSSKRKRKRKRKRRGRRVPSQGVELNHWSAPVAPVANFKNSCIDHHAEDGERGFESATLILWRRGLLAGLGSPALLGPVKSGEFTGRRMQAARPAWPACPTRSTRGVVRVPFASLHWRTCASAA